MNKVQIHHIVRNLFRKLSKYSCEIMQNWDTESIHHFRVTYKKLRAFLHFLSLNNYSDKVKISKKLKSAYQYSGAIRNLQLHKTEIAEANLIYNYKPLEYLTFLQSQIEKLKPLLSDVFSEQTISKNKKKVLANLSKEMAEKHYLKFISKSILTINKIISMGKYGDNQIHSIRKKLKDINYTIDIFKHTNPAITSPYFEFNNKFSLVSFLEQLGNYQDKCTSINLLNALWLKDFNFETRLHLNQIKSNWIKEKEIMKSELINKFETDFKRL